MELKYVRMYFPPPPSPQGWLRWDFLTPKWLLALSWLGFPAGGWNPWEPEGRSPPSIGGPGGGSPLVGVRGRSPRKIFDGVWCQNSYILRRRRLRPRRLLQRPQRLQPGPQHRH